jgi:hypothetical protein
VCVCVCVYIFIHTVELSYKVAKNTKYFMSLYVSFVLIEEYAVMGNSVELIVTMENRTQ